MFGNRKDPLADITKKVMEQSERDRQIVKSVNDQFGVNDPRQLPHEKRSDYDAYLQKMLNEGVSPEKYSPKQKKLASLAGNPEKIDAADLAAARSGKAGHIEEDKNEEPPFEPTEKSTDWKNPKRKAKNLARAAMKKAMEKKKEKIDEAKYSAKAARAGEDIGKSGKMFAKISKEAGERYGSEESGKKVAGAVLKNIRSKHMKEEEQLDEKAVSKAQHRFFGLVRAIQKGEAKGSPKAEKAASEMSTKEVRKFAKTKEKGLPEKVDESLLTSIQEEIRNSLLEKANYLKENGTQEQVVEFLNNLTMEERSILNLAEEGAMLRGADAAAEYRKRLAPPQVQVPGGGKRDLTRDEQKRAEAYRSQTPGSGPTLPQIQTSEPSSRIPRDPDGIGIVVAKPSASKPASPPTASNSVAPKVNPFTAGLNRAQLPSGSTTPENIPGLTGGSTSPSKPATPAKQPSSSMYDPSGPGNIMPNQTKMGTGEKPSVSDVVSGSRVSGFDGPGVAKFGTAKNNNNNMPTQPQSYEESVQYNGKSFEKFLREDFKNDKDN